MPFTGPQGQGPFEGHEDCVSSMEDEEGVEDEDALCAVWERQAEGKSETKMRFDELSRERLLQAAIDHPKLVDLPEESAPTPRQKATAGTGFDVVGVPSTPALQKEESFDPDDPPEEFAEQIEADDFVVYGKASIEQHDVENQRISVAALEDALDRFFGSEDAPGIISRGHADVPVGMPVREHTLDEDTTLVIDGEEYTFEAGETLRTEAKDADDDGLPELWLVSRLANDSDIARETRYKALTGDLNGYSVTVKPKDGARRRTAEGEDILALDLHAVTVGSDELIKNKGSEFDVAEVKALPARVRDVPANAAATFLEHLNMGDNDSDSDTDGWLLRKLGSDEGGGAEEQDETEQKGDDEDDETDEEAKGNPVDAALEAGTISAAHAGEFREAAAKMGPEAIQPLIDAISENDLDVNQAVDLMNAMDAGDSEPDDDTTTAADDEDMPDEEDEEPEKDDAGELKAAAEEAVDERLEEKLEAAIDDRLESKLDDRLPEEDILTEESFEQKLEAMQEDLDDEVVTKAEFEELIQNSEVVRSPTPTAADDDTSTTLGDSVPNPGGD